MKRPIKLAALLAAGILSSAPLTFAEERIAWQDYSKAVAAAKKANKPVLLDFWRPG